MRIWMVGVFSLVFTTVAFSQADWPLGVGPPQHGQSGPLVTAGGFGDPITHRAKSGKQLIVIATSQSDGIAFGLPS